jgi:hypothetical protein
MVLGRTIIMLPATLDLPGMPTYKKSASYLSLAVPEPHPFGV